MYLAKDFNNNKRVIEMNQKNLSRIKEKTANDVILRQNKDNNEVLGPCVKHI